MLEVHLCSLGRRLARSDAEMQVARRKAGEDLACRDEIILNAP